MTAVKKSAAPRKRAAKKAPTSTVQAPAAADPAAGAPAPVTTPRPVWEGGGETRQQYHARVNAWNAARREARNRS